MYTLEQVREDVEFALQLKQASRKPIHKATQDHGPPTNDQRYEWFRSLMLDQGIDAITYAFKVSNGIRIKNELRKKFWNKPAKNKVHDRGGVRRLKLVV